MKEVFELENKIKDAYSDDELLNTKIESQEAVLNDLSDDNMRYILPLIASQTNIILHHNFDNICLQYVVATNQQIGRIRHLEEENKSSEKILASLKKVEEYTRSDGKNRLKMIRTHRKKDNTMKKIVFALGFGLFFTSSALAQVIDPEWRVADLKMRQEEKACTRLSVVKRMNCVGDIYRKYQRSGDMPGTKAYVKRKYGRMSNAQLNRIINENHDKYIDKVRDIRSGEKALPGEITSIMFDENQTLLNELLDSKGGAPNPYEQIFGKGTSFGSTQHW